MDSSYDSIAQWYHQEHSGNKGPARFVMRRFLEFLGDIHGLHLCDLACGSGGMSRELRRRGALVTGLDISPELLAIAQETEKQKPLGIQYRNADARCLEKETDASYDAVVSNLGLMDIPDLASVYRAVTRVLRRGAWFAYSITHPCFQSPGARWKRQSDGGMSRELFEYFREGVWRSKNLGGVRGRVGAIHRTLSTYVNLLDGAGLALREISEPRADIEAPDCPPGYFNLPAFLFLRAEKTR